MIDIGMYVHLPLKLIAFSAMSDVQWINWRIVLDETKTQNNATMVTRYLSISSRSICGMQLACRISVCVLELLFPVVNIGFCIWSPETCWQECTHLLLLASMCSLQESGLASALESASWIQRVLMQEKQSQKWWGQSQDHIDQQQSWAERGCSLPSLPWCLQEFHQWMCLEQTACQKTQKLIYYYHQHTEGNTSAFCKRSRKQFDHSFLKSFAFTVLQAPSAIRVLQQFSAISFCLIPKPWKFPY